MKRRSENKQHLKFVHVIFLFLCISSYKFEYVKYVNVKFHFFVYQIRILRMSNFNFGDVKLEFCECQMGECQFWG